MKHLKDRLQHIVAWWKWAWILSGIGINGRKEGLPKLEIAYRRALHYQREPRFGAELVTHDWESDFPHENGNYRNNCVSCRHDFTAQDTSGGISATAAIASPRRPCSA